MKKSTITILLVVALVVTLFAGCTPTAEPVAEAPVTEAPATTAPAPTPETPTEPEYGILRYAGSSSITGPIKTFNPMEKDPPDEANVNIQLYQYLPVGDSISVLPTQPELADGMPTQMDADGYVWQIKIKDGVKWPNGDTLDANDVFYSFKEWLNPMVVPGRASTFAHNKVVIKGANDYLGQGGDGTAIDFDTVGIKFIDDLTIEITTEFPAYQIEVAEHFGHECTGLVYDVIYEECFNADRTENDYGTTLEKFMASAMFIPVEWNKGTMCKFIPNPEYPLQDVIKVAGIERWVSENAGTQRQMWEKNELDWFVLGANDLEQYEQDPRTITYYREAATSLVFNTENDEVPILNNKNFRLAVRYALDRETIAGALHEVPMSYLVPDKYIMSLDEPDNHYRDYDVAEMNEEPNHAYNPDKARELFDLALQEEGLDMLEITITYAEQGGGRDMKFTELVQESLMSTFGADKINVKTMAVSTFSMIKEWKNNPQAYEISLALGAPDYYAPVGLFNYYTDAYSGKYHPYHNDKFEEVYYEAAFGPERRNSDKMAEYIAEMENLILFEDVARVPVTQIMYKFLLNDRVVVPVDWQPHEAYYWNFVTCYAD